MGNSLVQWRVAIGGFHGRICSSSWSQSTSGKSNSDQFKEEVSETANKVKSFFLYFIQEVLLVITYSVLSLTALSILYSLNTVSESSSQNGSSHGTSKINLRKNH